jgi:metal-responsive CopG/Arc/MetJ family transcriptional regulator
MATEKIAISLPKELLRLIDLGARSKGLSRSEFIRQAIAELFRRQEERAAAERYVEGYRRTPEDDQEIHEALQTATAALAQEPWG